MNASRKNLYAHVEYLTNITPFRNYRNLDALQEARSYIKEALASYGYATEEQVWTAEGEEYRNVLASYQPEKTKRLIVGAHYDVCGDQPGADDNASAVAGLLESARMIQEAHPNLTYGIDFVAYCLEEPPFFASEQMGSYVHAESIRKNKANIIGMVCFEMIGYFSDEPYSQMLPSPELEKLFPNTGNFIVVVGIDKYIPFNEKFFTKMAGGANIDVKKMWFGIENEMAGLSDHSSYWAFDIPALMINDTSFLRNRNYHQPTDTIDTLDFRRMTEVVTSSYQGIVGF